MRQQIAWLIEPPVPLSPQNPLSGLTLSHSAWQHNNAKPGCDQSALSLHHPHATPLQFFNTAMNSEEHKKLHPFLCSRGLELEQPTRLLCSLRAQLSESLLSPVLHSYSPPHWRPLDWNIKHSMKVTFIDLFELIFPYR